jgi:hypothetical protein
MAGYYVPPFASVVDPDSLNPDPDPFLVNPVLDQDQFDLMTKNCKKYS